MPTVRLALAPVPIPEDNRGIFTYGRGASNFIVGGFVNVNPAPGFIRLTETTFPFRTEAIPTFWKVDNPEVGEYALTITV